jgi:MFS family permease
MARIKMSRRDMFTLIMLFFMTTILYADQLIINAIIPQLSAEYGIDESKVGMVGSAFIIVGVIMSLTFGYFADKVSRKALFIIAILVGEIPCVLTGIKSFTPDFTSFVLMRILSGIGLGAIYPLSHSILSDYFKEDHRAAASAWMGTAWSVGGLIGVNIAGFLTNAEWNTLGWRLSFIIIGVPNIPVALLFWAFAREPERGRTEDALEELIREGKVYKQTIGLKDFKTIFTNKTNIFTLIQGIPGTIPWGVLTFWFIAYFEAYRKLSKESATLMFDVLGAGTLVGTIVFAYIGERLYRKDPKYMPILCGTGIIFGIIPSAILINMPNSNMILYMILGFLTGFFVSVAGANYKAILMNVNKPENRGSVFAVSNLTDNIGMGLGPLVGALLLPYGYQLMVNFAIVWWLPCGLLFLLVSKFIDKDRLALRSYLDEKARALEEGKE